MIKQFIFLLSCSFSFLLAEAQIKHSTPNDNITGSYQSPLYNRIDHVFISGDSQSVIAADSAGYVFFWQKADGALSKIMRAHDHGITHMAFSSDGKYFATTSSSNHIFLWDITGKKTADISLPAACTVLEFSGDNNSLVYAAGNTLYKTPLTQPDTSLAIFQADTAITCGDAVQQGASFAVNYGNMLTLLTADGTALSKVKTCGEGKFLQYNGGYLLNVCKAAGAQLFEVKGTSLQPHKKPSLPFSSSIKHQTLLSDGRYALFSQGQTVLIWDWRSDDKYHMPSVPDTATVLGSAGPLILTGNNSGEVILCKNPVTEMLKDKEKRKEKAKPAQPGAAGERKIRAREDVEVQSAQLDIYVWDDENIDGDTISMSMNGQWVLKDYMVTKEKKKITVTLEPGKKNTLVLYAENLGRIPPNTAVIFFNDGTKEHTLTLNSDLRRSDAVNFILKK